MCKRGEEAAATTPRRIEEKGSIFSGVRFDSVLSLSIIRVVSFASIKVHLVR